MSDATIDSAEIDDTYPMSVFLFRYRFFGPTNFLDEWGDIVINWKEQHGAAALLDVVTECNMGPITMHLFDVMREMLTQFKDANQQVPSESFTQPQSMYGEVLNRAQLTASEFGQTRTSQLTASRSSGDVRSGGGNRPVVSTLSADTSTKSTRAAIASGQHPVPLQSHSGAGFEWPDDEFFSQTKLEERCPIWTRGVFAWCEFVALHFSKIYPREAPAII
ncbi:unnamed protein product, partial [Amoebophrya sp. A25]|eukprot:GSA25T00010814001.1